MEPDMKIYECRKCKNVLNFDDANRVTEVVKILDIGTEEIWTTLEVFICSRCKKILEGG